MRKMILLAAMAAIAALMLAAAPAFADDNNRHDDGFVFVGDGFCHDFPFAFDCNNRNDFCDFNNCNRNDFCDFFDNNNCNRNDFCDFNNCNNNFFVPGIEQTNEQEVESGDATQNINVTGGGANSNQTVGVQGVTNTGNATNNTGVIQAGTPFFDGNNNNNNNDFCDFNNCNRNDFCDFFDINNCNRFFHDDGFFRDGFNGFNTGGEVEVQDTGNLTISPSQTVTGNQQVNQAAAASAFKPWWQR